MQNCKKLCLVLLFVVFSMSAISDFVLAENGQPPLEVTYPQIPGAERPTTVKTPLPEYVKYIFNFSIMIAGFIAFIAVFYGGVRYLTSAGNPSIMGDAKSQIFAGFLGLIILLSSYLILTTINPQLVILKASLGPSGTAGEVPEAPGVYLCLDASKSKDVCDYFLSSRDVLPENINKKATYIYFKNVGDNYGAVLHEDKYLQGSCKVFLTEGYIELPHGTPQSITVFKRSTDKPGGGVSLYEFKSYKNLLWSPPGVNKEAWPYVVTDIGDKKGGRSIIVNLSGAYLAVVYKYEDASGACQVFTKSNPDLAPEYIGQCGFNSNLGCFGAITILPIKQ